MRQGIETGRSYPGAIIDLTSSSQIDVAHARLVERGYIHYYRVFSELTQSYKSALMLGHAVYLTRYWNSRYPDREGWFWAPAADWTKAIGLTTREQESVRRNLRQLGLWEEVVSQQWCGPPARLHCRLNLGAIASQTGLSGSQRAGSMEGLARVLNKPLLYFKPLADIAGGAAAGLALSYFISLFRNAQHRGLANAQGFFPASIEGMRVELAFSEKVLRGATEKLRRAGLIQMAWNQGAGRKTLVRVNATALISCIEAQAGISPQLSSVQTDPDIGNAYEDESSRNEQQHERPRLLVAVLRERGLLPASLQPQRDHAPLVAPNGGFRHIRPRGDAIFPVNSLGRARPFVDSEEWATRPLVDSRPPFCRTHIQNGSLQKTSSYRAKEEEGKNAEIESLGEAPEPFLDFSAIDQEHRAGAAKIVLKAAAEDRQRLLDELAGYMRQPGRISSPMGWLFRLTEKCIRGDAVFAHADTVAKDRSARFRSDSVGTKTSVWVPPEPVQSSPEAASRAIAAMLSTKQRLTSRGLSSNPLTETSVAQNGQQRIHCAVTQTGQLRVECAVAQIGPHTQTADDTC